VWYRNLVNEEALAHWGAVVPKKNCLCWCIYVTVIHNRLKNIINECIFIVIGINIYTSINMPQHNRMKSYKKNLLVFVILYILLSNVIF